MGRLKNVAEANKSSAKIDKLFLACLQAQDLPGSGTALKFLQMGCTMRGAWP